MEKTRVKMKALAEEEGMYNTMPTAAAATLDVSKTKGSGKTMGRPKTKPESRQMSLHLAVDLIERIDAEAERVAYGNKSGLVTKILEEYFAQLKK